ncbi:hypothetical protein [Ornithinimicrobium sp. INDO-MA30-4]|uniref:hypothetical protein n=1 Tax=Ornithinimicrobium sp. INDO-MA30-4 TaxID=2908651 RepID=UPI001F42B3CC|nr:hypothetical protein [Ornithinimicrobium sp. INDO-MA30-4]UJH71311.1 hypothetical protein L0A91_05940 [Ornithinimicrobium sp. INDO-MA30-4]
MTASTSAEQTAGLRRISVLLFSDNRATRDAVRVGVGSHPDPGVKVEEWMECATAPAVELALDEGDYDVLILDGEAQPYGGLGLCRQLKNEIFDCPPVLVLTGRPNDNWLASWSLADGSVAHPLDPAALAAAVARLAHS